MRHAQCIAILLFRASLPILATQSEEALTHRGTNPIRHVITLLQTMQKKIKEDSETRQVEYDKFMCFCETTVGDVTHLLEEEREKVMRVKARLEAEAAGKTGLENEIAGEEEDKAQCLTSLEEAVAARNARYAVFQAEKGRLETNIAALGQAITAVKNGQSFLQLKHSDVLKHIADEKDIFEQIDEDNDESPHDTFVAFLQGGDGSPKGDEIVGVLSQLKENFEKALAAAQAKEDKDKEAFDALVATNQECIANLNIQIVDHTSEEGDLAVSIVHDKTALDDTESAYASDAKIMHELKYECAAKLVHHEEQTKRVQESLEAIASALKVLETDDSLDLFKKTFKRTEAASFFQMQSSEHRRNHKALKVIRDIASQHKVFINPEFISLALHGKRVGLETVVFQVQKMIKQLETDEKNDDMLISACTQNKDLYDRNMVEINQHTSTSDANLQAKQNEIDQLDEDIEQLQRELKKLKDDSDKRYTMDKKRHAIFLEEQANRVASKQILKVAENRLNKFYNPSLYKQEEGLALIHSRASDRPRGDFTEHNTESKSQMQVNKFINALVKELDEDMIAEEAEDLDNRRKTKRFIDDSDWSHTGKTRVLDKAMSDLAQAHGDMSDLKADRKSLDTRREILEKKIAGMKARCDWLIGNKGVRERARESERQSLINALNVLSGANAAVYGHEYQPEDYRVAFPEVKRPKGFLKYN